MKRSNLFSISLILICLTLILNDSSNTSAEVNLLNNIFTNLTYSNCSDFAWNVTVVKNGGGYSEGCTIPVNATNCKCEVSNNPSAGYYTITVDNGGCTAVEYNVYHPGYGYTDVYVDAILDCYR